MSDDDGALDPRLHVHWFGESWGAPINEECPSTAVPVHVRCLHCHDPIDAEDQGVIMPVVMSDPSKIEGECLWFLPEETGAIPWVAHHYECHMETILGPGWRTATRWPQV